MKSILHIITSLGNGGAEGVLVRVLTSEQEFDHTVVSLTKNSFHQSRLEKIGVRVVVLDFSKYWLVPNNLWKLTKIIWRYKPAVIQTWMYHADLIGGILGWALRKTVVWNVRHSDLVPGKSSALTILIAKACALLSAIVPARIVYCAHAAREEHEALGYNRAVGVVIQNGFDPGRFFPNRLVRDNKRKEWQANDSDFVIGMLARYNSQKGHDVLLEALSSPRLFDLNLKVLLAGPQIDYQNFDLVAKIEALNLGCCVSLIGEVQEPNEFFNAVDISILPSIYGEGFPNVVAESMLAGTPCISTDVGDTNQIIEKNGWICRPGTAIELTDAILDAHQLFRSWLWAQFKCSCRRRILDKYSHQRVVSQYKAMWSSLF